MIIEENRILTPENQREHSTLYYKELIAMEAGEEMIVDDCSGGLLDLAPDLTALSTQAPCVKVLSLSDLNIELSELLKEAAMDPEQTVYILPGGGGQRLVLSLEEQGMYMPNKLGIAVERPKLSDGTKGEACVSEESIPLLAPFIRQGYNIVVLDDAINGGGTLLSIRKALMDCSENGILENKLMAAVPVRFSVPDQNDGQIEYGVDGYDAVFASKVIVGPDTDQSSPVTFLSSFIKEGKMPTTDARIQRIAEKSGTDSKILAAYFIELQKKYATYLLKKEGYKPENPATLRLIEILTAIGDPELMANYLRAILTLAEIENIATRNKIGESYYEGKSVRETADDHGVSRETATRVYFYYREHPQGYQATFDFMDSLTDTEDHYVS